MNAPLKLQVTPTAIHDVLVIEPKVFGDERGWFTESFNAQDFSLATGLNVEFVQGTEPPAELQIGLSITTNQPIVEVKVNGEMWTRP